MARSICPLGAFPPDLNLALNGNAPEIESLDRTVEDNGGCYVIPAFCGLFAPHWRSEARGIIVGLTSYITKGHLACAVFHQAADLRGGGRDERQPCCGRCWP